MRGEYKMGLVQRFAKYSEMKINGMIGKKDKVWCVVLRLETVV